LLSQAFPLISSKALPTPRSEVCFQADGYFKVFDGANLVLQNLILRKSAIFTPKKQKDRACGIIFEHWNSYCVANSRLSPAAKVIERGDGPNLR